MKCPRCGLLVTDAVPRCLGCDFSMADLDDKAGPLPARAGRLTDIAELLSPEGHEAVGAALGEASAATGGEIAVALFRRCPVSPSVYAFWLFNRWQLGGPQHSGLLLLVALEERRIECEVGYAWEAVLDEDATRDLLEDAVLPAFRAQDWERGLLGAISRVQEQLTAAGVSA